MSLVQRRGIRPRHALAADCERGARSARHVPSPDELPKRLHRVRFVPRFVGLLVVCSIVVGSILAGPALAQPAIEGYANYETFTAQVKKLAAAPNTAVESLARTLDGREIWLLRISRGKAEDKPAMLIVGSVHAPHMLGSELAVRLAESLSADQPPGANGESGTGELLDRFSFYIIPRPNPDASEAFFRKPYQERNINERPTDDDRDGATGEDPAQDLNGDGWITQLRVFDRSGPLLAHPADARVSIEAEPRKNEQGRFQLLSEGIDDDHDEAFNEDGPGGVAFDRNFTFRYPFFQPGAGANQVSEIESRAVADFAFAHPNIAVVFSFTPEDNLLEPWKAGDDAQRIKSSVLSGDAAHLGYLAEQYRTIHGGKDAPGSPKGEGSFAEWAYFHFGRWSLAARAWWIPKVATKPEAEKASPATDGDKAGEKPAKPAAKPADEKRGADDVNALAWFDQEGIDGFAPWQEIAHPDFPDRQVQVGGFKPFARLNPPAKELAPLAAKHLKFLVRLGELLPNVKIERTKVEPLGGGVFRVTTEVINEGYLPTMPAIGQTTGEPHPLQVEIVLPAGAKLVTGHARTQLDPLAGSGGKTERVWLVLAGAGAEQQAQIKVWSPSVGADKKSIELK
jgi:hypothetical protein